jgi:hypothetical protein
MNGLDQLATISSTYFQRNGSIINFVIAGIIGVAFVRSLFNRESVPWRSKGITLSLWLLMAYTGLSLMWSPSFQKGSQYWLKQGLPYFILLMVILPYVLTSLQKTYDAIRLVQLLALGFVAYFVFGVEWGLRGLAIEPRVLATGEIVTETSSLSLGEMGASLVVISGLLWTDKSLVWRVLRVFGVILGLAIAAKSGSRGQFFFALIAVTFCMPFMISVRKLITPKTVVAVPLLAVALFFVSSFLISSESKFNQNRFEQGQIEDSYAVRLNMCAKLLEKAWEEPVSTIFGLGNSASFHHEVVGFYPHNIPLEILGEEGLLGFVLFMGLLACSGVAVVRLWTMNLPPEVRSAIGVLFGMLLLQFLISLKQGSLITSAFLWSAFLLLERVYNIALRDQNAATRNDVRVV